MSQQADDSNRTIIFVDIDGVLNVGSRDNGKAPILVSARNIELALQSSSTDQAMLRLRSISCRAIAHGESSDAKYSNFRCPPGELVCDLLVGRLANIIRSAGNRKAVTVVLSSSWRKPKHNAGVAKLERSISAHLGEAFSFDARTQQCDESTAGDRLATIGQFLATLQDNGFVKSQSIKVLVLEDFFITKFCTAGWQCGGRKIRNVAGAEAYLKDQAQNTGFKADVKLIHTCDDWTTSTGVPVEIGCGLTLDHCTDALQFLASNPTRCSEEPLEAKVLQTPPLPLPKSLNIKEVLWPVLSFYSSMPWAWISFPTSGKGHVHTKTKVAV